MMKHLKQDWFLYLLFLVVGYVIVYTIAFSDLAGYRKNISVSPDTSWQAPSIYLDLPASTDERNSILLGDSIIRNTFIFFGPNGKISQFANGMNCQNCHLNSGRKNKGNNFSAVYSTYPKYRARSGSMESIYKRVSDCFERSLRGQAPDSNSRAYKAIYAYIKWLGKNVPKGAKPTGSGISVLSYLTRAADPTKGEMVYTSHCASCHGNDGAGTANGSGGYIYPPLWGNQSYTTAAGLYRIGFFAGFVKYNMPYHTSDVPVYQLTDAEAWDVAAFVNNQPRPHINVSNDWPDIAKKPYDYPYGPFADGFTERQHKFGPYLPIIEKQQPIKNSQHLK